MQSLAWKYRRLRSMSAEELAWRVRCLLRDGVDRYRFAIGLVPGPAAVIGGGSGEPGFRVAAMNVGEWAAPTATPQEAAWRDRLARQADAIAQRRLSFFDLRDCHLGDPIDWNRDHAHGKAAPMGFSAFIDYRDFQLTGDCKLVWEPNRHHHLVVLARAYRATGDLRYASAAVDQLESWLAQCPFGRGMNWRSPLELGIRLINWVWMMDLIRDSGLFAGELRRRVLHAAYLHLWEITRKYSRASSANNHLVGEAAGVFIASSYFREFPNASRWREESAEILARELFAQTYSDGCTREQALGYHLFVSQFFLVAALVGRSTGRDFSATYWERLEKMFDFLAAMIEGGSTPPMFGDCDDGYVLDLGAREARAWLAAAAIVFGRGDFKAAAPVFEEPARWLLGRTARVRFDQLAPGAPGSMVSRAFPESGHYLLQCGARGAADAISIIFDCGELGFGSIAAHGHADALSFTLRAFGRDVFVDPGTYDYFTYPQWRGYFRSTRAHNTLVVDGRDQSEMLGAFLWGGRARAKCLVWEPTARGAKVSGEHDGYLRLPEPVLHRRTLELDGSSRTLTISDQVLARGRHEIAIYFHMAEGCKLLSVGENTCHILAGNGAVALQLDPGLRVETYSGSENPIAGWVSRGYHHKAPATTIVARGMVDGNRTLASNIRIGSAGGASGGSTNPSAVMRSAIGLLHPTR